MRLTPLLLLWAVTSLACAPAGTSVEDDEDLPESGEEALNAAQLNYEGQLRGATMPSKTLHLTFDDGPGRRTAELAKYLKDEGIAATFFINGINVPKWPGALEAVIRSGHSLANHTQTHKLLPTLSNPEALQEIQETFDLVQTAQRRASPGARVPMFLRAPYAGWTESLERSLTTSSFKGYVAPIHWDIGSRVTSTTGADWECWSKKLSVETCGELYLTEIRAKNHGIVLLHDIHSKTIDLARTLVPKLKAAGYRFVAMSEVPSVRAASAVPLTSMPAEQCFSGTLVKRVGRGACVQSSSDGRWNRCTGGEWTRVPSDASLGADCSSRTGR